MECFSNKMRNKFSIYIHSIMYYTQENLLKLANKNIFFNIDNQIYTNEEINDQTKYIFSLFMFFDFFVNSDIENKKNMGSKIFFTHKISVGFKIIELLMNKLKEISTSQLPLNDVAIYFESFWKKDELFNHLNFLINNIENANLKKKLNLSLYYVIIYYDDFLKSLNNIIIKMLEANNININRDNIKYYFGETGKEKKEQYEVALILASMCE